MVDNSLTPCAKTNKKNFTRGAFYLFKCCTNLTIPTDPGDICMIRIFANKLPEPEYTGPVQPAGLSFLRRQESRLWFLNHGEKGTADER